jgi:hypothetical protein
MPNVEQFMDHVVTDLRQRLALLDDDGDRRSIEDGIALLREARARRMDALRFERLLAVLRAGTAPAEFAVLRPGLIGGELSRRWAEYVAPAVATR